MNKTRFAVKTFAATVAATVMVLGSLSAPADAAKDTGWGKTTQMSKKDTGWG